MSKKEYNNEKSKCTTGKQIHLCNTKYYESLNKYDIKNLDKYFLNKNYNKPSNGN